VKYPFFGDRDTLTVKPSSGTPVLRGLADSPFAPTEWMLRPKALHAKSKTCRRVDFVETNRQ
jgi:hypothetical protein